MLYIIGSGQNVGITVSGTEIGKIATDFEFRLI